MVNCAGCGRSIHRDETVTAVFTQEGQKGQKNFYHKNCEERTEHFTRWKEEAPWAFRPTRLTLAEWRRCSLRKHLGVWQSIFIARRDEDVWCPDCGLKITRHEGMRCQACGGPAVVLAAEPTRMVFTHGEPLYKLLLHCTEKGEEAGTYAIISGYTPVAITPKKKGEEQEAPSEVMMLNYQPKGDPKKGLTV